ncbi:hypothetical protein [Pseudarthrobacter niigatensis]|uniref:Uncharacterized protein n=1 Tax=Pseudarthrobacter niigatensis TaxID=369935 RepID=A0AAJ1SSG5_9MICC|nr:hypothetical protein [Pseudarthrobacter niigatensis]MDQ0145936.1 hypothetical protein [Pseudarthrobacter niigatensis]MDQ0266336.1 hypothetical protein [Pseudarthrobacter niigatensis]
MNVVVTCLLVSVSGDAQSPFPDAPGAHPDYDAFHFNNWLPERKDPLGKILDARRRWRAEAGQVALAPESALFYN